MSTIMLQIVKQRFIKFAERHLRESTIWDEIFKRYAAKNDLFGMLYASDRCVWHNQMAEYWLMAIKNLHYVQGTWRYRF